MRSDKPKILAAIKKYATTKSSAEIADMLGVSVGVVSYVGRLAGFRKPYVGAKKRAKQAHMRKFIQANAATQTLAAMGRSLGVSRERVRQLRLKWQITDRRVTYPTLHSLSDRKLQSLVQQPRMTTFTAVAKELGVPFHALRYELRRRGIKGLTWSDRKAALLKRGLRFCSRCGQVKPLQLFERKTTSSSGPESNCLTCRRAKGRGRIAQVTSRKMLDRETKVGFRREALTERENLVVRLRDNKRFSFQDIGDQLGRSRRYVKDIYRNAHARLEDFQRHKGESLMLVPARLRRLLARIQMTRRKQVHEAIASGQVCWDMSQSRVSLNGHSLPRHAWWSWVALNEWAGLPRPRLSGNSASK